MQMYNNCSCTPDGVAVGGPCEVGCDVSLIIYSVLTFIVVFLGSMGISPCTVIVMRYHTLVIIVCFFLSFRYRHILCNLILAW